MSSNKFIISLPEAQAIVDVVEDKKVVKRVLREVISGLYGVQLALESIAQGEKIFEVWELRKKLAELKHPDGPMKDATFIVLTAEERDFVMAGLKRFDWTVRGTVNFWIRWEAFFDAMANIRELDERNPPVEYVEWKRAWDADKSARDAEKRAAEDAVLAKKTALDEFEQQQYTELLEIELADALDRLKEMGRLGEAATVDDVPASVRAECENKCKLAAQGIAEEKRKSEDAIESTPKSIKINTVTAAELSTEARPVSNMVIPASQLG
jgi:hypothetical protein